jgi:hypothetical protein
MALAVLTLTVAQLFDLGTFVRMVAGHGAAAEANPLVRFLLEGYGLPLLAVAKIAGLALVVAVIAVLARGSDDSVRRRATAIVFAVAILAGLVGGWSNAAVIL